MTAKTHPKPSIIYPESDGQPMTESDPTRDYLIYAVEVLRQYFQSRQQVYVSGNLFIYYREGDPKAVVSPDVLVIFGVSKRQRRSDGGRVGRGWGRREIGGGAAEHLSKTLQNNAECDPGGASDATAQPDIYRG